MLDSRIRLARAARIGIGAERRRDLVALRGRSGRRAKQRGKACESGQAHTAFAKPWDRERLTLVLNQVLVGI